MSVEQNANQNPQQVNSAYQQHYQAQAQQPQQAQPVQQVQPVQQAQPAVQPAAQPVTPPAAVQPQAQPSATQPIAQPIKPIQSPAAQPVAQPVQQVQPVAQPQPATASSPEGKQHVHHSYIWLGSLRAIGILIIVLIVGNIASLISLLEEASYSGATSVIGLSVILGLGILAILVIFGLFAGFTALSYKHLYYEIGPSEFSLYSGILSKKRVHVPYQRIQSVDQKASLLQRLFGVCNVSIDTAGGAANKAILIPYLTKQQAEALKSELFTRKLALQAGQNATAQTSSVTQSVESAAQQSAPATVPADQSAQTQSQTQPQAQTHSGNVLDIGEQAWNQIGGVFAGEEAILGSVTYEYGLTNKELIFTGLSNNSSFFLAIVVVIAFVLQAASTVFEIVPSSEDAVIDNIAASAINYGVAQVSAVLIFGLIAVALVVWILSTLSACLSFGGFHARRRGERIEVERGLLQHQSQSVSVDRVQSVVIKQTFVRRILGYCELSLGKIDAMEESNSSEQATRIADQGLVIHPFVKKSEVPAILNGLVPEFADVPSEMKPLSKKALRRGLIRRCILNGGGFWLALITALTQAFLTVIEPFIEDPEYTAFLIGIAPIFGVLYLLAVVLFVVGIVGTVFWARESGFAYNRRFMMVKNGGLSTQSVSFPRNKIQFGFTRTNPFQRVAKTATICAVTAAGIGGTSTVLIDATQEDADQWLTWLEPHKS